MTITISYHILWPLAVLLTIASSLILIFKGKEKDNTVMILSGLFLCLFVGLFIAFYIIFLGVAHAVLLTFLLSITAVGLIAFAVCLYKAVQDENSHGPHHI